MSFKHILLFFLLLPFIKAIATPTLSEKSKVIMFTCEPGSELYAGFGHSAIWVSDPYKQVDKLYNYGTFDFNTPHFYVKFIRGKLDYMLTSTTVRRFLGEYKYRKIGVTGQTLNLNLEEKQKLFDLLEVNIKPDNRFYKYDFFYDNCATRIRDIVVEAVDGEVNFNTPDESQSFRKMLFPYLEHTPWTKMGINLVLGLSSDKVASPWEYQYLPYEMQKSFESATIKTDKDEIKLVTQERKYLDSELEFNYNILTDPSFIFGLIFLLVALLTFSEIKRKKYYKWLDITLNVIGVVAGMFLFFMWVGTDHSATNQNLNILWLLPAQLLFLIAQKFNNEKRNRLVMISFILLASTSVIMNFWPQETELSFLIISMTFILRYLFHSRINKR